jgi:hypothetical protein
LKVYVERYPGLLDLIEEFEHLNLAREEPDRDAMSYFKRQKRLREEGFEVGGFKMDDVKVEANAKTETPGSLEGGKGIAVDGDEMGTFNEMQDVNEDNSIQGYQVRDPHMLKPGGPEIGGALNGDGELKDQMSFALNGNEN